MILKAEDLKARPDFMEQDVLLLQDKIDSLEVLIRGYTNNNFQNRSVRTYGASKNNTLYCYHPFLKVGDTVQITQSNVNDGLYTITSINNGVIEVDKELYPVSHNLVTKVEYPMDVKQGVVELMKWEIANRQKVGIKSETLSRYSVTYFDQDVNNQVRGYPISLLGFLETYKKARF